MLVITRFRSADDLGARLSALAELLHESPGCTSSEIGRNLDEPDLWVLVTRWTDVGSYRRALSSYEVKMAMQPVMGVIVDEPSAYETGPEEGPGEGPGTGPVWNRNIPR